MSVIRLRQFFEGARERRSLRLVLVVFLVALLALVLLHEFGDMLTIGSALVCAMIVLVLSLLIGSRASRQIGETRALPRAPPLPPLERRSAALIGPTSSPLRL